MKFRSALRINPFAKLLLLYLSGIIAGFLFHLGDISWIWLLTAVVTILTTMLLFITFRPAFHTNNSSGIISALLFISAGLLNTAICNLHVQKLKETSGFHGQVLLRIDEQPTETNRSVKCFATIDKVYNAKPEFRRQQKVLVYFEKDSCSKKLLPGNLLIATVSIIEIPSPGNPEEFDYRKYLASKKIMNQSFIRSDSWHLVGEKRFSLKEFSFRLQQALIAKYKCIGMNPRLFSILSAVTLGYKNELDANTKQAFSKAGVMHVMALSGFNVAVIAFALNSILFFANRIKYANYLRLIFIILFIWFFAFITGFSPSVTRASLMISLVLTGKELRRNLSSTNILYASAFLLVALQPALIYDVGFQLSFAAVFGIIVFHPALEKMAHFRNRILSRIWQLFTVSLAAQLATMPLTIAYFHQFPAYFWITNLYVVPLVSVIISVAMVFLLLSFIQPVMMAIGKILGFLVALLYKSVSIIEIMPFSVISDIHISMFQLILLLAMLAVSGLYINFRRKLLMIITLCLFILFEIAGVINTSGIRHQQIIVVGQLKNATFINLIEGNNSIIISDSIIENSQLKYSFGNFWIKQGITSHSTFKLTGDRTLIFKFGGNTILLADSPDRKMREEADVIIITCKADPDEKYFSDNKPSQVILDSSVPYFKEGKWQRICSNNQLSCYSVKVQGAWIQKN